MRCHFLTSTLALMTCISAAACGGGEVERGLSLGQRLTAEAANRGVPPRPAARSSPEATSVTGRPSPAPQPSIDGATLAQINNLARLVLVDGDLGPDFQFQRSDRAFRQAIVQSQAGITELAAFLDASSLLGASTALHARTTGSAGTLSSIVYLFGSAVDARGMVDAYRGIETTDYIGAISVDLLPTPDVGDSAVAVRFRTTAGRSLEVVWAQGPLVGQITMRYADDTEGPDDVTDLGAFARLQAARMAAALP